MVFRGELFLDPLVPNGAELQRTAVGHRQKAELFAHGRDGFPEIVDLAGLIVLLSVRLVLDDGLSDRQPERRPDRYRDLEGAGRPVHSATIRL